MAIQFARVFGAEVTAFSTSAGKEEEARALGAHHFVNSRESKALKEVAGTSGLHPQHHQRRPGLGRLHPGAAAHRNAVLCRRSAVAGLVHAFPLISGLRSISGNPTGSPSG
jgi:alcohol/geraniol dehydrogenase (NADP+)